MIRTTQNNICQLISEGLKTHVHNCVLNGKQHIRNICRILKGLSCLSSLSCPQIFYFIFFPLAVEVEQVSSLGSEEEDEVGLWSLEPPDCQESLDKTSLTPSEGTEEPSSPAHSTRPHSLSPGSRNCWTQVESEAKTEEDATYTSTDREGDREPLRMYRKS